MAKGRGRMGVESILHRAIDQGQDREQKLACQLAQGQREALEQAVRRYTSYVSAVAWRTLAGQASREDLEEITADRLSALLDALWTELGSRAVRAGDRRRLLRAAELVKQLRGAAWLNVSAGQLSGWLCAGMFEAT